MSTLQMRTSTLSPTAKAALGIWLAQSPAAPTGAPAETSAICARLAEAARMAATSRMATRSRTTG
jgi:hypothetical protein